jgi:hypothetical protein
VPEAGWEGWLPVLEALGVDRGDARAAAATIQRARQTLSGLLNAALHEPEPGQVRPGWGGVVLGACGAPRERGGRRAALGHSGPRRASTQPPAASCAEARPVPARPPPQGANNNAAAAVRDPARSRGPHPAPRPAAAAPPRRGKPDGAAAAAGARALSGDAAAAEVTVGASQLPLTQMLGPGADEAVLLDQPRATIVAKASMPRGGRTVRARGGGDGGCKCDSKGSVGSVGRADAPPNAPPPPNPLPPPPRGPHRRCGTSCGLRALRPARRSGTRRRASGGSTPTARS